MFKEYVSREPIKALQITQELYDKIINEGEVKKHHNGCEFEYWTELRIDDTIFVIYEGCRFVYINYGSYSFTVGDYLVVVGDIEYGYTEKEFNKSFELKQVLHIRINT
jgi:hypothetical protein